MDRTVTEEEEIDYILGGLLRDGDPVRPLPETDTALKFEFCEY